MSFWNTSDGKEVEQNTEFDAGGGNMEPIPSGTNALAVIDEAKWDNKDDNEFISIRWSVMKPEEFQNRKIFQKVWCKDFDPNAKKPENKKDKALRMLSAIDANAGGKLRASGVEPTDDLLQSALVGKAMVVSVQRWDIQDGAETISGNWISAVAAKGEREVKAGVEKSKPQSAPQTQPAPDDDFDSIPF